MLHEQQSSRTAPYGFWFSDKFKYMLLLCITNHYLYTIWKFQSKITKHKWRWNQEAGGTMKRGNKSHEVLLRHLFNVQRHSSFIVLTSFCPWFTHNKHIQANYNPYTRARSTMDLLDSIFFFQLSLGRLEIHLGSPSSMFHVDLLR